MTKRSHVVALAAVFALTGVSGIVAAQQRPSRVNDQQVGQLLTRTQKNADQFRRSLDQALGRSRIDGSREEDDIKQLVTDFAETTNHLRDHFDRRQVVTNDIEDVLRRGVSIDSFMQRHQLAVQAENDWLTVRRDLDELARAYNVAWNWSDPVTQRTNERRDSTIASLERTNWRAGGAMIRGRRLRRRRAHCRPTSGNAPTSGS